MHSGDIAVFGRSDFLTYWKKVDQNVVQLDESMLETTPHAFFLHIGQLAELDNDDKSFSSKVRNYKSALKENKEFVVIIDYAHEGISIDARFAPNLLLLHTIIREFAIEESKVVLIHHNTHLLENLSTYRDFCATNSIKPFDMVYCHTWLLNQSVYLRNHIETHGGFDEFFLERLQNRARALDDTAYRFLCFNYFPRFNRVAFLLNLLDRGIFDQGLISFAGFRISEMDYDFYVDAIQNLSCWRGGDRLAQHLPYLAALSPLRIDSSDSYGKMDLAFTFDAAPYDRTSFSVITDTGFSSGIHTRRITEKFLKSILQMHPFFLLGEPHGLQEIRNLGFRTFGDIFDESYDIISAPETRMNAVINSVTTMCTISAEQLRQKISLCMPAVSHNLYYLYHNFPNKIREISEFNIVNTIKRKLMGFKIAEETKNSSSSIETTVKDKNPTAYPAILLPPLLHCCILETHKSDSSDAKDEYILRADQSFDNHCFIMRAEFGHEKYIRVRFSIENCGFSMLMICIKSPMEDDFRLTYNMKLGIIISDDVHHDAVNIATLIKRTEDGRLDFDFSGTLGRGIGEIDVMFFVGQNDLIFSGDENHKITISNFEISISDRL